MQISVSVLPKRFTQWHATVFAAGPLPNIRYPMKAPTATANITQPLYVMNNSLKKD